MQKVEFDLALFLESRGRGQDIYALGAKEVLCIYPDESHVWQRMQSFIDSQKGHHVFFVLSYQLKDYIEKLESKNTAFIPCPLVLLFSASIVLENRDNSWTCLENQGCLEIDSCIKYVNDKVTIPAGKVTRQNPSFKGLSKEAYLTSLYQIKEHIQAGDIYEMNFCQEFTLDEIHLDPRQTYTELLSLTNAPYSCFLKFNDLHLLCASPESYLEKKGNTVHSSPIKGTRRRHLDPTLDARAKAELKVDQKERAENIMICDLVRNDLSRIASKDSVHVDELCEVYSFDTVHQMISTISCKIPATLPITDLFQATFPMGSMTGAPKVRAMELIETYENFRRGWFSGSVGFISPIGDMKSNVIIRSILYDSLSKRASIAAGGAITSLSEPEAEYEESLLKAEAMLKVLLGKTNTVMTRSSQED
jgi:para-aminobenzoate synthetase component 1